MWSALTLLVASYWPEPFPTHALSSFFSVRDRATLPIDFVTNALVYDNVIEGCGNHDFNFGGGGKNGEGVCEWQRSGRYIDRSRVTRQSKNEADSCPKLRRCNTPQALAEQGCAASLLLQAASQGIERMRTTV